MLLKHSRALWRTLEFSGSLLDQGSGSFWPRWNSVKLTVNWPVLEKDKSGLIQSEEDPQQ